MTVVSYTRAAKCKDCEHIRFQMVGKQKRSRCLAKGNFTTLNSPICRDDYKFSFNPSIKDYIEPSEFEDELLKIRSCIESGEVIVRSPFKEFSTKDLRKYDDNLSLKLAAITMEYKGRILGILEIKRHEIQKQRSSS